MGLIDIALFRSKAAKCGIYEITQKGKTLCVKVNSIKEEQVARLISGLPGRVTLHPVEKPYYAVNLKPGQTVLEALGEISAAL